jgi:hypothetical protein
MAFQSFASERFRQLYLEREGNVFRWGWIGSHEAYNELLRRMK